MFKNEYQGGAFVEIFSAQGKNPGAKWKILGSPSVIWKEFDKEVKSFVFVLEGSSQTNKIQLPKENKQILGLIQRFLVLQIYVPLGQDFSTELLITDLRNIKRRLYLSTVHKELSSTPLHAKIPLFMIKRKIWCNLCIDLVAFTSEIFKGAVFQSLDGIIVSANCKLRKIFTLKSKPQDTADKDAIHGVPFPTDEPTDIIPRSCQLTTDVPHVTQLLNMTKLRQTEIKFGGHPLKAAESDQFINRGAGTIRNSKNQDVCHIAFGSKVLGPPPLSGRRNHMRLSSETLRSVGSKSSQSCQQPTVEKCVVTSAEMSEEQGDKENIRQIKQSIPIHANLPIMHPHPPQEPATDKPNNRRRFWLKSTSRQQTETPCEVTYSNVGGSSGDNRNGDEAAPTLTTVTQEKAEKKELNIPGPQSADLSDEWVFPENEDHTPHSAFSSQSQLLDDDSCITPHVWPEAIKNSEPDQQADESQMVPKDIFTFSSRPRSAPHGKTQNMSPEECPFILDLKEDNSMMRTDTQLEDDFYGGDSSEEEYNWRNYQPSQMSESELQMLASLRRQQNEELEDTGAPHGLSASQVDNCNVSISTSSDDTTTWNSCLPPPVNQGRHYQKEMNPPSPSNPRDWLNMLSPPIVPPGQQSAEQHPDSSGSLSAQGEEDLSVEEDEEVLTLLYDPCLNCYFDPQTGKYYELV
ncbi:protein CFAP20DC isoform X1 [Perognathus longimembris pacificus]|uniref:protein CFAP20DC isoform X1 n=1 Tax=Perognathus longimembris pacificus TaxID=214514 RepID=UPI002019BF65|nr:protein CFAP20DC isoform X1 [Perognathus longimembris pacificus]